MASTRGIQGSSVALGVVLGFVLYAVTRHIFWIALGVVIAILVMTASRRRG